MMNRLQYLMTKLAEEAAEIGKEAAKVSQFGLDSFNPRDEKRESHAVKLRSEINDLLGIVNMLNDEFGFDYHVDNAALDAKRTKVNKYYAVSQRLGMVEKESDSMVPIRVGKGIHFMSGQFAAPKTPMPKKRGIYIARSGAHDGFIIEECEGHDWQTITVLPFTDGVWVDRRQFLWWDRVCFNYLRVEEYPEWAPS